MIKADTEIRHDILGSIRYDDGQPLEHVLGDSPRTPMWVARPGGWSVARPGGFEDDLNFYLACGSDNSLSGTSLQRAITLFANYKRIEATARQMTNQDLHIKWFDCTASVTTMALTDARDGYILWTAVLDAENTIIEITEGYW